MRLVITGHDDTGRSIVESDTEIADHGMATLFSAACAAEATSSGETELEIVPAPGAVTWLVVDVPPDQQMRAALAAGVAGVDAEGWHATPTVDFVLVLDGTVALALDTGEVELHAGDGVVQRGTRHAWRNRTETPVRMSCVLFRA